MGLFHRHDWRDTGLRHYWRYPRKYVSDNGHWGEWDPFEIYQIENPGTQSLDGGYVRYPTPHTVVHQKCSVCNRYREQHLRGIVEGSKDQ